MTAKDFAQQLQYLRASDHTPVGLNDVVEFLHRRAPLPARPVVLTVDDGQQDNYTAAFPLLCQYGVRATFFGVEKRCANIVNAKQLDRDIADGALPDYALYVPNMDNDGDDTDVGHAS